MGAVSPGLGLTCGQGTWLIEHKTGTDPVLGEFVNEPSDELQ